MLDTATYQLTDNDIIEDLATQESNAVLGYCGSYYNCYLALLLRRKYPELKDAWVSQRRIALFTEVGGDPVALFDPTEMQQDLIGLFDEIGEQYQPVKKQKFLTHLKEQDFDYYTGLFPTHQ